MKIVKSPLPLEAYLSDCRSIRSCGMIAAALSALTSGTSEVLEFDEVDEGKPRFALLKTIRRAAKLVGVKVRFSRINGKLYVSIAERIEVAKCIQS